MWNDNGYSFTIWNYKYEKQHGVFLYFFNNPLTYVPALCMFALFLKGKGRNFEQIVCSSYKDLNEKKKFYSLFFKEFPRNK